MTVREIQGMFPNLKERAASPGTSENAQSFQPGNGKRLVAGHGAGA